MSCLISKPLKVKRGGGFTRRKHREDRGNGRRTRVEQRTQKEAILHDKWRISSKEPTDISLSSSQQEAARY